MRNKKKKKNWRQSLVYHNRSNSMETRSTTLIYAIADDWLMIAGAPVDQDPGSYLSTQVVAT
jgi:hypothetical protein